MRQRCHGPYCQTTTEDISNILPLRLWTTQDLLNILRQVDYAIERGHRSPRVAGLRHPRSPRTAHQEYSPLMIAGWCVGVFAVAAAIMVHGEKAYFACVYINGLCLWLSSPCIGQFIGGKHEAGHAPCSSHYSWTQRAASNIMGIWQS